MLERQRVSEALLCKAESYQAGSQPINRQDAPSCVVAAGNFIPHKDYNLPSADISCLNDTSFFDYIQYINFGGPFLPSFHHPFASFHRSDLASRSPAKYIHRLENCQSGAPAIMDVRPVLEATFSPGTLVIIPDREEALTQPRCQNPR